MQDKVDYFSRRVNDAEPVRVLLQRRSEELLVQFHQNPLARFAVVETPSSLPHTLVESIQIARLVLETKLGEVLVQRVQRPCDRIGCREIVLFKQRFEYGPRQDVLRHHVDGAVSHDRLVDRLSEFPMKGIKPVPQRLVLGVIQQVFDPLNHAREDFGDILGPSCPVLAVTAFLDNLGEKRLWRQIKRRQG